MQRNSVQSNSKEKLETMSLQINPYLKDVREFSVRKTKMSSQRRHIVSMRSIPMNKLANAVAKKRQSSRSPTSNKSGKFPPVTN